MKLMICGGGTGGHIYPALAVVEALERRGVARDQMLWVGTHGQMEEQLVPQQHITLRTIGGGPVAGVPLRRKLSSGVKLLGSVLTAWRLQASFAPDALLLTGGYVNLPVALAARMRRIPAVVYLPDIEPGAAIKRIAPLATRIACTAEASKRYLPAHKVVATGYPVRDDLRQAAAQPAQSARAKFDLDPQRPTLFVFGGSRGAQSINRALTAILDELLPAIQIIHVSGELTWPEVEAAAAQLDAEKRQAYRPFPYLHERMGWAFRAASLVVARAGASMLGEGPAFGVPSILVPYPHAWRYQKVNADYLAEHGAAVRLDDELLAGSLLTTIRQLIDNPTQLAQMAAAAKALDRPQAADNIAAVLLAASRPGKTVPLLA